jgi:hypothetical protein
MKKSGWSFKAAYEPTNGILGSDVMLVKGLLASRSFVLLLVGVRASGAQATVAKYAHALVPPAEQTPVHHRIL